LSSIECLYFHCDKSIGEAQAELERCRAEARSGIEANQRAIEQVRGRKSGIKELAQKIFERVKVVVQATCERYQKTFKKDIDKGIGL